MPCFLAADAAKGNLHGVRGSLPDARPGQQSAFLCIGPSAESAPHAAGLPASYGATEQAMPRCSPGSPLNFEAGPLMAPHLVYAAGQMCSHETRGEATGLGMPCKAVRTAGQPLADRRVRPVVVEVKYDEATQTKAALDPAFASSSSRY